MFLVCNETASLAAIVIISFLKAVVETQWVTRSFTRCSPDIFTSSELDYGLFWPKLKSMLVGTVERQTETVLVWTKLALQWYAR